MAKILHCINYTSKTQQLRRSWWGSKPSPQNPLSFEPTWVFWNPLVLVLQSFFSYLHYSMIDFPAANCKWDASHTATIKAELSFPLATLVLLIIIHFSFFTKCGHWPFFKSFPVLYPTWGLKRSEGNPSKMSNCRVVSTDALALLTAGLCPKFRILSLRLERPLVTLVRLT